MSKFYVGQRVKIVGPFPQSDFLNDWRFHETFVGTETTVLEARTDLKSAHGGVAYRLDVPEHPLWGEPGFLPENLRAAYDGNTLVSWDTCAWKPEGIAA